MSIIDPKNDFARGDVGVQTPQTGIGYASDASVTLGSAQTSIASGGLDQTEQNMMAVGQKFQAALNGTETQPPTLIESLLEQLANSAIGVNE